MVEKSTVDEIRRRFDADVERFSDLDAGQRATVDAPLVMELVAQAAAATTPRARRLLDVGCGAGNYSLKLLQSLPDLDVELVDLSRPMLDRALERVGAVARGAVVAHQADVRDLPLEPGRYDLAVAAATLHHLRGDEEWEAVFRKLFLALAPGGSLWISDMVEHSLAGVQERMWRRYGDHLAGVGGAAYRDQVFAYVEKEDTPRPLLYQLDLLRAVGFAGVEVLHKNGLFAAFGASKGPTAEG